jgi:hypothetical protein
MELWSAVEKDKEAARERALAARRAQLARLRHQVRPAARPSSACTADEDYGIKLPAGPSMQARCAFSAWCAPGCSGNMLLVTVPLIVISLHVGHQKAAGTAQPAVSEPRPH